MMRLRPPASPGISETAIRALQVLKGGGLRIRFDAILVAMVEGLGAHVHAVAAPFAPESGAYAPQSGHHHHHHGHHDHEH